MKKWYQGNDRGSNEKQYPSRPIRCTGWIFICLFYQPTNQPINQLMDKASYRGALSQGIWKRSSTLVHGIATRIWTVKWKWKRWKWHENQLLSHSYLAHLRFEQVMNEKLETIQLTKTVSVWTWLKWNNMICGNRLWTWCPCASIFKFSIPACFKVVDRKHGI